MSAGGAGCAPRSVPVIRNQRVDTDQALVAAAQAGDEDAVTALVHRYQHRLFNFAQAMTGNPADAEDLAQETFIRALRGLHRFRGDCSFKNWLYRIAANAARSLHGSRQRRAAVWEARVESDEVDERHLAAGEESVERQAIRRQAIDRALAALPVNLRIPVVLRDVEGLEYHEIAAVMNVPIGTVMSRIFRGRRRLRPLLAEVRDNRVPDTAGGGSARPALPLAAAAVRAQVKS